MINRRKLVKGIGASAIAVATPSVGVGEAHFTDASVLVTDSEEAERILYELASFDARYYSEEGVPMVLICEDLAATPDSSFVPNATNSHFSEAFNKYASLLGELRRDLAEQDVASVVELIAHRDFSSGGGGTEK